MSELLYEVRSPKTLMEMNWVEVEELLKKTNIAFVSTGACEQHGAHLPLGTDTIQSTETLRYAHDILLADYGVESLIAPTVPWGICPGAMCYPGSITLQPSTLIALLEDICEGLYHHGFKNIILFLGHDENYGSMMVAAQNVTNRHSDSKVVVLNPMPALKASERASLNLNKSTRPDGHAGAGETSRALCLYPNLVNLDAAKEDILKPVPKGEPILGGEPPLLGGGVYNPAMEGRGYDRASGDPGQTGDPRLATAEAGIKAYTAMGKVVAQIAYKLFVEEK
ncbi:MAG: creatininase family protein [Clostridia bacterium]